MGWKAVKDHYHISHIVYMAGANLLVGTECVPEMIEVAPDGSLVQEWKSHFKTGEIDRIQTAIKADPAKFRELLDQADVFETCIPVFSFQNGGVVEQMCEEFGYPNVTHDGQLMMLNTHFLDEDEAARQGKKSLEANQLTFAEMIVDLEDRLQDIRNLQQAEKDQLERLERLHPQV